MKVWVPSLIAGPHPGGALRIKEKEGRKLHVTLQAISVPVECAPKSGELSGPQGSPKASQENAPIAS